MGSRDQHPPHCLVLPLTCVHPVPVSAALHLLAPLPNLLFPSQMWAAGPLLTEASARIFTLQPPLHWHPQPSPSQQTVPLTYVTFYIVWTTSSRYTFFFFKDLFIYGFSLWAFSSCGEWGLLFVVVRGVFLVLEHGLWAWAGLQYLWRMGLVALRHIGSSWTRDRTCVPVLAGGFLAVRPPGKPSPCTVVMFALEYIVVIL